MACDPAKSPCLFSSLMTSTPKPFSGINLEMELRGDSQGYIGLGLTADDTAVTHT
ncbi:hypothetical protein LDENG_00020610 [Lucifuga dentata]|nr:hypothetical protein LDENG_00020610 [Lucifuga dentata]